MANPPARGLLYTSTATNDAGDTVLTVACDCATITDVTVVGTGQLAPGETYEFAPTCDCLTTRWFKAVGPVSAP